MVNWKSNEGVNWDNPNTNTGGNSAGGNFILKLTKSGLNTVINNSMTQNLLSLLSITDVSDIYGRSVGEYSLSNGLLKLPLPKGDALVLYDMSVRVAGTIAGGTSATTARELSVRLTRSDNTVVETLPLIKVGPNPLQNRAVIFNSYTKQNTDPFIVNGLKFLIVNNSDQQATITGIEILICGSDS